MKSFLAQLNQLFSFSRAPRTADGIAQQLLESAEARAGHDPREAEELRIAASAYLRVVR